MIVTRFAPSPTGFLHIGGARTALFNYLFARHHGGRFCLRIEDTDRARSTQEAIDAIIEGLRWMGLQWDGEIIHQYARAARHAEVARTLVERGQAYYCYATQEELQYEREKAQAAGKIFRYPGTWRDRAVSDAPADVQPSIRIKAPVEGSITIEDRVQGPVTVACSQLDDMVLLRSDGTPTYMLAVVVDDHDMGITHIIRGDDHLTNAFRQMIIYQSLGWKAPEFAHIPLIHGPDGAKLSKRHGALGVEAYRDMGYLPEALRNYLLRLGWAHGNDEIISDAQAITWFDLDGVGQSPSRFDRARLDNLNGHYIREADDGRLAELTWERLRAVNPSVDSALKERLQRGMPGLKQRARNIHELADNALFYVSHAPLGLDPKAQILLDKGGRNLVRNIMPSLQKIEEWTENNIEETVRHAAVETGQTLGALAQPLRAALTGRTISPGVFDVMAVLGKEETLSRLNAIC